MEIETLDRNFKAQDVIDEFHSSIWTERYYGDGEVQIVVPAVPEMFQKMPKGSFLLRVGSNEPMIIETHEIKENKLTVSGITITKWFNNRFYRSWPLHSKKSDNWSPPGNTIGQYITYMVYQGVSQRSDYLMHAANNGIPNPFRLAILGLFADLRDLGPQITMEIPYGPIYDGIRSLAAKYGIGMKTSLGPVTYVDNAQSYELLFKIYEGVDRTATIRLSPDEDSLMNVSELHSLQGSVTDAYSWAPGDTGIPLDDPMWPGGFFPAGKSESTAYGFDIRAEMIFADDIDAEVTHGDPEYLSNLLDARARDAVSAKPIVSAVDGEIPPNNEEFVFGEDYNLGDIIELRGHDGAINNVRVTEYIYSHDETGEREYPTVSTLTES